MLEKMCVDFLTFKDFKEVVFGRLKLQSCNCNFENLTTVYCDEVYFY